MSHTEDTPKVTIDELAVMINKGFKEVHAELSDMRGNISSLKSDVSTLKSDVSILKSDVSIIKKDIRSLNIKFDYLEDLVINNHGKRLRKIESKLQIA